jgi:hypothetical protein
MASQAQYRLEEGSDELGYLLLSPVDSIVPLAEDIGFEGNEKPQRVEIILAVRQKTRGERPVHVLSEEHLLTLGFREVHDRTGGVAGDVDGADAPSPERDLLLRSRR